jgi:hypothetical protein
MNETEKLKAEIARLREAMDSARAAIEYDDDISTALILLKNALKAESEVTNG